MRNLFNELNYEDKKELMEISLKKIIEEYKKDILDYNINTGNILVNNNEVIELYEVHYFMSALSDDFITLPIKGIDSEKHGTYKVINRYNKRIENHSIITKDY